MAKKRKKSPSGEHQREALADSLDKDAFRLWGKIAKTVENDEEWQHRLSVELERLGGKELPSGQLAVQFIASLKRLTGELEELRQRYEIEPLEIVRYLFPPLIARSEDIEGRLHLPMARNLTRFLPLLEDRAGYYRALLASLDRWRGPALIETERSIVCALLANTEAHIKVLRAIQQAVKMGRGRRRKSQHEWAVVGDIATDLSLFLSGKIPGRWTRGKGVRDVLATRPYKTEALTITAQLISIAYSTRITPDQIRDRIRARRTPQ